MCAIDRAFVAQNGRAALCVIDFGSLPQMVSCFACVIDRGFIAADGRVSLLAQSIVVSLSWMAEVWLCDHR